MKIRFSIFTAIMCIASITFAESMTIDLGKEYVLVLQVPESLTFNETSNQTDSQTILLMKDKEGICNMRLTFVNLKPVKNKRPLEEGLDKTLDKLSQRLLPDSVESKISIQKLSESKIPIIYYELTDKREDAGDGRYVLEGVGMSDRCFCHFTIIMQQKTSSGKEELLNMLASMDINKKITQPSKQ